MSIVWLKRGVWPSCDCWPLWSTWPSKHITWSLCVTYSRLHSTWLRFGAIHNIFHTISLLIPFNVYHKIGKNIWQLYWVNTYCVLFSSRQIKYCHDFPYCYCSQMKLQDDNVFTPVCHPFCSHGGCTPPWSHIPDHIPWTHTSIPHPFGHTSPGHPLLTPSGHTPPLDTPTWAHIPPEQARQHRKEFLRLSFFRD